MSGFSEMKKEFKVFLITDYEEEGEYLSRMHSRGWKFVNVTFPGIYFFEKCTPEDVVYQLDYNEEGLNNKEEYIQMFRDCGWEYLMEYVGYTYFRKPRAEMKGDEKIFCDDESRLEMLRRVFQARLFPILIIMFCLVIPQFAGLMDEQRGDRWILLILYSILLTLYTYICVKFGTHYWNLKNRLKS